jgi:hypothetical protein
MFIRPSEISIKKGNLKEAKLIYAFIESLSLSHSEVGVVLLMGVSDRVKITTKHPGSRSGGNGFKLIKEIKSISRRRWSIDISDKHVELRRQGNKVSRDSVGRATHPDTSERGIRPCS